MTSNTALYELGAFSVREASPRGFAVYFQHGVDILQKPLTVPAHTQHHEHPLFQGQREGWTGHFRTKTAARRYMIALADAGILPLDRPATRAEAHAVQEWINRAAQDATFPDSGNNTAPTSHYDIHPDGSVQSNFPHTWGDIINADGTHSPACVDCGKFWSPTVRLQYCTKRPETMQQKMNARNVKTMRLHHTAKRVAKDHTMARPMKLRKTVVADARNRITLGALTSPGAQYLAVKHPANGTITLHPLDATPMRSYALNTEGSVEEIPYDPNAPAIRHHQL